MTPDATTGLLARFVARFEGYARKTPGGGCKPYLCSAGVLTLGYGATGRGITAATRWTHAQALARFAQDLASFEAGVLRLSPGLADEPETRRAAVVSWAYNCGLGAYQRSGFRRAVDRANWAEAARQLKRWDKAGGQVVRGLKNRRHAEAALLLK